MSKEHQEKLTEMERQRRFLFLSSLLEIMRPTARNLGYALAVHGSMMRDLDVVAVPWVRDATDHKSLAHALAGAIRGTLHDSLSWKPHRRASYVIRLGLKEYGWTHAYIDLGIMLRESDEYPLEGEKHVI